ncbi:MAG: endopeptidase La [bacterium]
MPTFRREDEIIEAPDRLPLLPLRDVVVFPYMMLPLLVGRAGSVAAIRAAMEKDKLVFAVTQRRPDVSEPVRRDLHRAGAVIRIHQLLRLPDDTLKILAEGVGRARMSDVRAKAGYTTVRITPFGADRPKKNNEMKAAMRQVAAQFEEYVKLNRKLPDEIAVNASNLTDPGRLADTIAAHMGVSVEAKQSIFEAETLAMRFDILTKLLAGEIEILRLERKIDGQVRSQVQKNQKEFYLNEQLKAIRRELGREGEGSAEADDLIESVRKARMPKEAETKALAEVERLRKMAPLSPEATVIRNYVECLVSLPWRKETTDQLDVAQAEIVLNEDHYALEKVKERILEYVAVIRLSKKLKGPILCFVGPPGVGKTSLGKSIARALGRKFVRVSLGGVRDEAEIRGHRRTYIGSMPGRIMQGLRKAGARNPVFLLDEVDKMTMDYHGDPASALLEVLDPEQNNTFNDHYLDIDFDLSQVLFITTANMLHAIPAPLQDRMEIIRLPGYLLPEKVQIARRFLIPQQAEAHGLAKGQVVFAQPALRSIISEYTREAGVRNLEREIAKIMRKVAREIASRPVAAKSAKGAAVAAATMAGTAGATVIADAAAAAAASAIAPIRITQRAVTRYLGVPKFSKRRLEEQDWVGVASGLAWTGGGGDLLMIEATTVAGRGKLILTGSLGDVMQESAQAALTYARSRAELLKLDRDFYQKLDIHIHVPEGAIPKDGPSAGITIATALISALTNLTVRRDLAMTGEITLRGNVLPIGGLSEKLVAAHQAGHTVVLLPAENRKDLADIPAEVRRGLSIRFVETMDQVLDQALVGDRRAELPFFRDISSRAKVAPVAASDADPARPADTTPPADAPDAPEAPPDDPEEPGVGEPGYTH